MKRMISLFIVVVMLLGACATSASAIFSDLRFNVDKDIRRTEIFNMRIIELENQVNKLLELPETQKIDIHISQISTIHDFSGNQYTLVECVPSGYMIYHDESGVFVESSAIAMSPYGDVQGEKIYGGPNEYYIKSREAGKIIYEYTKTDDVVSVAEADAYSKASDRLNSMLMENKNIEILNYINNNQPLNIAAPMSTEVGGIVCVKNYRFLVNLLRPGYTTVNGSGICGYIAATMLLAYEQYSSSAGTFDTDDYWWDSSVGGYVIDSNFTMELYNLGVSLGYGTSTTSVAIHYTVKKYLENRNIAASHTSLYSPIATNMTIASKIKDDRPVIWFGVVSKNSADDRTNLSHAVLAYGYEYSFLGGYAFVAHFGWDDSSVVTYSGLLGSLYTFTLD